MAGHGSKYPKKKEAAIAALVAHVSVEEAARSIGIGTQTLYRWLQKPDFAAALRKEKQAAFRQVNARLQQATLPAAALLLKMTGDDKIAPSVRVRAAGLLLSYGYAATESAQAAQLEDRITQIEQGFNSRADSTSGGY